MQRPRLPAESTSFGSHSTGRPKQIKALIALLTGYWRLNPGLQLHEILDRLTPGAPHILDGSKGDDAALIAALRAIPELDELSAQWPDPDHTYDAEPD
jgi:hypothetical protein